MIKYLNKLYPEYAFVVSNLDKWKFLKDRQIQLFQDQSTEKLYFTYDDGDLKRAYCYFFSDEILAEEVVLLSEEQFKKLKAFL